ncbi:hypothetical protein GQ600_6575 [Phytophthora cactorum]|nr:hypothetical protein GQ600_6575 [Phytophthora cactorum]
MRDRSKHHKSTKEELKASTSTPHDATEADSKPETAGASSEHEFTLCYSSVRVVWDRMGLVEGDLKHRSEVEEVYAHDTSKAKLSEAMAEAKIKRIACRVFANPPGASPPSTTQQGPVRKRRKEGESDDCLSFR